VLGFLHRYRQLFWWMRWELRCAGEERRKASPSSPSMSSSQVSCRKRGGGSRLASLSTFSVSRIFLFHYSYFSSRLVLVFGPMYNTET
jgi:hypothetical protein